MDQLLTLGSAEAFYEYDFGDSWLHRLELVSRRPADEDSPPARLIDGARRGPLEDSGGFPGYDEIMDALADPTHPEGIVDCHAPRFESRYCLRCAGAFLAVTIEA